MKSKLLVPALAFLALGAWDRLPANPMPNDSGHTTQGDEPPGRDSSNFADITLPPEVNTVWCLVLLAGLSFARSLLRDFRKRKPLPAAKTKTVQRR